MITLDTTPNEGGSMVITVNFKDVDGVDFTPLTCVWSLTDKAGNIINSRDRVSVLPGDASHDFVIFGDDILSADGKDRVFLVEGTYAGYMNDQPFREEARFSIQNTVRDPA